MARVLVVDDEPQIRRFLRIALEAEGHEMHEADGMKAALRTGTFVRPDVAVVDLGLPDGDGIDLVRRMREWTAIPILVLSVRADETDKVAALDAGADDYVVKPFGTAELMARLRSLLRRTGGEGGEAEIVVGDLRIDLAARVVTKAGSEVRLSPREYDLLRCLAVHRGKVMTHGQILREVWGPAHVEDTQYLRVYVGQLRRKLEADPLQPRLIQTEPAVGYRMVSTG